MRTEAANKARAELAEKRRKFCLANRGMKAKTMAKYLGISVRQVRRYLAPTASYKHRKQWEKRQTQQHIAEGKTKDQIREDLRITDRQYYYYKDQMKAK